MIDEFHPFLHGLLIACHKQPFLFIRAFLILNLKGGGLTRYGCAFELFDLLILDGLSGDFGFVLEGGDFCLVEEGDESFWEFADIGQFLILGIEDEETVVAEKSRF